MLSMFEIVVPANNLVYIKNFHTFLSVYFVLDDKATKIEKWIGKKIILPWLEKKAIQIYKELRKACKQYCPFITLENTDLDLFTTLFVANQDNTIFGDAQTLFTTLSAMRLEFAKLKFSRPDTVYKKDI